MRRYSPEIETEIANIRDEFNAKVIWLEFARERLLKHPNAPQTDEDKIKRKDIRNRLRKVRVSIRNFNEIVENLPDSMNLEIVSNRQVSGREKWAQKWKYKGKVRPAFLKQAANDPETVETLRRMGLSDQHIQQMKQGLQPTAKDGRPMNLTVDHVRELTLGGTNSLDNLRLVPEYINALRNNLIISQIQAPDLQMDRLVSITLPADAQGNIPLAPYFPMGYQPSTPEITAQIKRFLSL